MALRTLFAAGLLAALGISTTGCTDGYGYSGVSLGYGSPGYYDYGSGYGYDGYGYGSPGFGSYFGWYGDYYYPGTGYYVYDRYRRPYRWNDGQRRYWEDRRRNWRGDRPNNWGGWSGGRPGWDRDRGDWNGPRPGAGPRPDRPDRPGWTPGRGPRPGAGPRPDRGGEWQGRRHVPPGASGYRPRPDVQRQAPRSDMPRVQRPSGARPGGGWEGRRHVPRGAGSD